MSLLFSQKKYSHQVFIILQPDACFNLLVSQLFFLCFPHGFIFHSCPEFPHEDAFALFQPAHHRIVLFQTKGTVIQRSVTILHQIITALRLLNTDIDAFYLYRAPDHMNDLIQNVLDTEAPGYGSAEIFEILRLLQLLFDKYVFHNLTPDKCQKHCCSQKTHRKYQGIII